MSIVERARVFASAAHAAIGQVRKYNRRPYIEHPARVALIVKKAGGDENMIAAAWLHDVVEDTGVILRHIRQEFGDDVAELVEQLTDVAVAADGNRAMRAAINLGHTAKAGPRAKTIKLADLYDNTSDIVEYDPKFAKVYLPEKEAVLKVLTEGDPTLWAHVSAQLHFAKGRVGL